MRWQAFAVNALDFFVIVRFQKLKMVRLLSSGNRWYVADFKYVVVLDPYSQVT